MRLMALVVVAGLLRPVTAFSQFMSGNTLYDDCSAQVGAGELLVCTGYVMGLVEGMMLNRNVCPPDGVTVGQVHDVVLNYLREQPQRRHEPASMLAGTALVKAFPCKEQAH